MQGAEAISLTVADAAKATGLSTKALRRRIERGTLDSVLEGGVRRIPMRALLEGGLLVRQAAPRAQRPAPPTSPVVTALLRRLAGLEARLAVVERRLADYEGADEEQQRAAG